jgi:excisionase family DNA binding protein
MTTNSSSETTNRKLYSMKELADFLGCSLPTAQRIKSAGRIPFVQIGRKVIFDCDKIIKTLERQVKN